MKTKFPSPSALFFPSPAAPSPFRFSACAPHLRALFGAIPPPSRDEPDDGRGHFFAESPALCDATARTMRDHPDLFDAGLGARIGEHLGRACAFYLLHTALASLTERARIHYQREQRTATVLALDVLGQARAAARSAQPASRDRLRETALAVPEALYRAWRRRLKNR